MSNDKNVKPDNKEFRSFIKDYNKETYNEDTSNNEISSANHQAKQDYQKDGEPFGPLSNRDLSEKEDVPSKE